MKNDNCESENKIDVEYNPTDKDINNKNKFGQNLNEWIKKRKILMVNCILIILLVGGVGVYFYFNEPVKRFETYFASGKYEQAIDIYNQNSNNSKFENSINGYLINKLNELRTSFNDEKITYEDAIKELDQFPKLGLNNDEINSQKELINKINDSMTAYKNAKQLISDKKSFEAIDSLNKVIKEDKNYDDAQNLIKEQLDLAKKQKLDEAQNYASKKDYANALGSMESILKYFPDDTELKDKENTYKQSKIDADKEKAVSILTQKNPKNNYTFTKMVTIEGKDYYAFEGASHEAADDCSYCINVDTGELMYYWDDTHYMTENQMNQQNVKLKEDAIKKAQQDANKASTTSSSSGINYTIQSIRYSEGIGNSAIDIKCSNTGNKYICSVIDITFYDSNNKVIGNTVAACKELGPNQWRMTDTICQGNVKNYDHFYISEQMVDMTEQEKSRQDLVNKFGYH